MKKALIEDVFKIFEKQVLSEKINKNKKNHDYCVRAYSQTKLMDLSAISAEYSDEHKSKITNSSMIGSQCILSLKDVEIILPFENCFFEMPFGGGFKRVFIFLREYEPAVYTGALVTLNEEELQKDVFVIQLNADGTAEMSVNFSYLRREGLAPALDRVGVSIANILLNSIEVINNLSPKKQNIYVAETDKKVYYTLKDTKETIKVNRPIYLYYDKDKEDQATLKRYAAKGAGVHRELTWSVRGHWRRLANPKTRGKNREGLYIVEGFTWVLEHTCGNGAETNKVYIAIQK